MRAVEAIAVAALGGALATAVVLAAAATLPSGQEPGTRRFRPPEPRDDPHGRAFAQGAASRRAVDPLRPPGLPDGASIDPTTGLLSGLELRPAAGEEAVTWQRLKAADGIESAAALAAELRALEGATVVMAGFLMPLYEIAQIREFLLVGSHYACCFGKPPGVGGMVLVRLGREAPALRPTLEPLRVRGTLRIHELRQGEDPGDPLLLVFHLDRASAAPLKYE